MLFELLVLEAALLFCELVIPAALPAASACALCWSWLRSADAVEELLLDTAPVPLCNALTRLPASDSNCCRLMEPLPFDICENRALVEAVWALPPVAWLRKLLNSLWLMLPSPFESMAAKSFSSVCDRLEELLVPLLPLVPLVANSEL